jgi:hypothetical protein
VFFCTLFLFAVVLIRGWEHGQKELAEKRERNYTSRDVQEILQEVEKAYEVCIHVYVPARILGPYRK